MSTALTEKTSIRHRYSPSFWLGLCTLVLVLGLIIGSLLAVNRVFSQLERQDCVDQIQSEFMFGVAAALDAPPAPNEERDQSVQIIKNAAKKLDPAANTCG